MRVIHRVSPPLPPADIFRPRCSGGRPPPLVFAEVPIRSDGATGRPATRGMIFYLLCLGLLPRCGLVQPSCSTDVPGSYGDPRETGTSAFANLVGLARGVHATGALRSGRSWRFVMATGAWKASACRALCASTPGCLVFTHAISQLARAVLCKPFTRTQRCTREAQCDNGETKLRAEKAELPFLPFPESLTEYTRLTPTIPAFSLGFSTETGRASAALLAVCMHPSIC